MTIATQEIMFGIAGQSLELVTDRPITSITSVSVHEMDADDTSSVAATTGSAAIDTATESLTVAAGPAQTDPRKMTMASTAGFVAGRRYMISGGGLSESFEIDGTPSSTVLYARHPIWNDYAIGATIAGTLRATISVSDTWAAASGNLSPAANPNARYRVKWTVVHSDTSESAVHLRNLDLVRYGASPTVSPFDVDNAYPGWLDALPVDHQKSRGRVLIAEGLRAVKLDLYRHGVADQALRNAEVFSELVVARTLYQTVLDSVMRGSVDAGRLAAAKDAYEARIAGLVETPVLALDIAGGGAATTGGRAVPLWRR